MIPGQFTLMKGVTAVHAQALVAAKQYAIVQGWGELVMMNFAETGDNRRDIEVGALTVAIVTTKHPERLFPERPDHLVLENEGGCLLPGDPFDGVTRAVES